MSADHLSTGARRFLTEDIGSVMQLELVLLLHREAQRPWSAAAAARELRAPQPWVEDQLNGLVVRGVAASTHEDDDPRYRFDPAGPVAAFVEEIARCYAQWRTRIIALIFRARPD